MISNAEAAERSANVWDNAWAKYQPGKDFDDSEYMTDQHAWFALTLTYKKSLDEVRVDGFGDKFYQVLKRQLIGGLCDRPRNRHLFPFLLGFLERGVLEGFHHHCLIGVHPTLRDDFVRRFCCTAMCREVFSELKSSHLEHIFHREGWVGYSSNNMRNRDRILIRQPVRPCHSKRTREKRRSASATKLGT